MCLWGRGRGRCVSCGHQPLQAPSSVAASQPHGDWLLSPRGAVTGISLLMRSPWFGKPGAQSVSCSTGSLSRVAPFGMQSSR